MYQLKKRPWRRYVTPWSIITSHPYEGAGTVDDPYVVTWLHDDKENPMTWAPSYQWTVTWLVAWTTLAASFASSAYSAAIHQIKLDFPGYASQVYIMGVSAYVLGFAFGPLLWAPMSEVLGRRALFIFTYTFFTIFNAAVCASQNIWTLIVLRFFAGSFGASPLTNAAGVVADVFKADNRGSGMAIFSAAPFTGPALGPIVGGFLGDAAGWRWVCGLLAILSGALTLLGGLFIPETYSPVLLRQRAEKLTQASRIGNDDGGPVKIYRSSFERAKPLLIGELLSTALRRPWAFLFRELISLSIAVYLAIVYGTLYMLFASFPIVYDEYRGWTVGVGGLAFLGLLVGTSCGSLYYIFYDNPRYISLLRAHRLKNPYMPLPPEARLPPAMLGAVLLPVGLFWFAWTCQKSVHWIVSILANIPFGAGMVMIFLSLFTYIADVYGVHAASALAANSLLRSLFGVAFPLFTSSIYHNLGVNWASTLIAFLALAMTPQPFLFYKFGHSIRMKSKYAREAAEIIEKVGKEKDVRAQLQMGWEKD